MKHKFLKKFERICAFALALIITLSLMPYSALATNTIPFDGLLLDEQADNDSEPLIEDGSEENPYLIFTAEDFDNIRANPDAHFSIESTIDFTDIEFEPIAEEFTGALNGNGKAIENLEITAEDAALFLHIDGGSVNNLIIRNAEIEGETGAATIAIQNSGTISDVKVESANVSAQIAGSIATYMNGKNASIENSGSYAIVSGEIAGGIVAIIDGGELSNIFSASVVSEVQAEVISTGAVFAITSLENFADNVLFLADDLQSAIAGNFTDENGESIAYSDDDENEFIAVVLGEETTMQIGDELNALVSFSQQPKEDVVTYNTSKISVLDVDLNEGTITALDDGTANFNIKIKMGSYTSTGGYTLPVKVVVEDPNSEDPNSEDPNSEDPNSEDPNSEDPNSEDPNSEDPNSDDPNSEDPDDETPDDETPDDETPSNIEKGTWQHSGSVHSYILADGTLATGPHTIDGAQYIFDESGNVYRYSFQYGDAWFIADSNGVLYSNGFLSYKESTTYYSSDGGARVGWITSVDGNEYYQEPGKYGRTNELAKGVAVVDGSTYLFASDGAKQTGTGWVDGVYLEDGIVPTGRLTLDGKTYIIGENGLPLTGEFAFEGVNYFADENGVIYLDAIRTMLVGEQTYLRYYDADGQVPTGWIETQGGDYYQNDEFYLLTGRQDIGNSTYFFGTNGMLSTEDGWAGDYYVVDGKALEGMQEIDGESYYFKADGIVTKGAFTYENNDYYADESGKIVKSQIIYNNAQVGTYYNENGIAASEGFYEVNGENYYQTANKTLATGKLTLGDSIYFFSALGVQITDTGWADDYYLQDGIALTGAYTIADVFYIFAQDGKVYKGKFSYEGNNYYADETGAVLIEDFYKTDTSITYYGENGVAPTGWFTIGTQRYYQKADLTLATQKTTIDGEVYYFNSNGTLIEAGWVGDIYVKDGQIVTGPQTISGSKYIFSDLGIPFKHNFTYNGDKYYANGKGVLYTHSFITELDFITYYDADGKAPLGWIELASGDKYYQSDEYKLLTGAHTIEREIYFFGTDGKLATEDGWAGDYYLQNGTAVTGMQVIENSTYYFNEQGLLVRGAFTFNGDEYYSNEQGALYILSIADNQDGTRTYYGENGVLAPEGWVSLGEERYYQTAQKTLATGKQTIGADIYFFSAKGELVTDTGWADNYYLVEGKALTGKHTIDNNIYIFNSDGEVFKGEFTFDGAMYTADENGALYTETIIDLENGKRRYLDENGIASTGFVTLGEDTYYQQEDFTLAIGMLILDDVKYFFDENGAQQTGTGWVDGYYLINGEPSTGKQTIGTGIYIFDEDGIVITGEFTYEGNFYIANAQGKLYTNATVKKKDSTLVYLNEQGIAPLGWIDANGKEYYQSETDDIPYLYTNFKTIEDIEYYFSANGELFAGRSEGYYLIDNTAYYILSDGRVVRKPTIDKIDTLYDADKKLYSVTVNFTISSASSAHEDGSISFDGGKTWQSSSTITVDASEGATFTAGMIRVRDALGQVINSTQTVYLAPVIDTPPTNANSGAGSYGIDVSKYQYSIDWNAVAASGIEFAIIRATSATNAGYYEDPYYEANVRGAKAAGIDVGVYIYSYASNYTEAKEEIDFFVNTQGTKNLKASGIVFDYPVYVDYEDNLNLTGTTYNGRTDIVRYMMQLLEQNGYYPGFYTYHYYSTLFDVKGLINEGYDFWYARYPTNPTPTVNPSSSFGAEIGIWQYCSDGNTNPQMQPYVNGIRTSLDLNYAYIDIPAKVHAFYGISGSQTTPSAPSGTITVENMLTVYDINTNQTVTDSALNIISKVVQAEVGGFNNTEVYKAQAVAAHSYILSVSQNGGVANVALTSASQSVISATQSVIDEIVTYNGLVATTMWSAAGSGKTLSSQEMWGGSYPYLISGIDSPGDLKATTYLNYGTSYNGKNTTITTERAISNIEKLLPGSTSGRTDYYNWLTNPEYNEYGHMTYITVMGVRMRVGKFYDNFWGMYSPHCTITYNNNGTWTFTTIGNGHGVGMSQWGAYDYALSGWSYSQILAHYYPGTSIETL